MPVPQGDNVRPSAVVKIGGEPMSPRLNETDAQVIEKIFKVFCDPETGFETQSFIEAFTHSGFRVNDPRLEGMMAKLGRHKGKESNVTVDDLKRYITPELLPLVRQVLERKAVVKNWRAFQRSLSVVYNRVKTVTGGQVTTTNQEFAKANPNLFGVSVCSVDGQRGSWGDARTPFCVHSISKAFTYAIAVTDVGPELIHKHIGMEPSGRTFDEICLDKEKKPHNPMINAGAIIAASLIKPDLCIADRFNFISAEFQKMSGGEHVSFDQSVFLAARENADRDYALAYYMRENHNFEENADIRAALEFYFQLCAIEVTCESLAGYVMAATLANGGRCPLTNEVCVSNVACQNVLSLMHSCGMYDYSGMFAFKIGIPSKSGISGGLIIVVPNVCGFAIYSPPIDSFCNSVKGVRFCEELVRAFNFHNYDNLMHGPANKIDPRKDEHDKEWSDINDLLFAAKAGDLSAVRTLHGLGMDVNAADYDGRTALHVATSEGHIELVRFLLKNCKANVAAVDRWGNTPLEDARTFNQPECERLLFKSIPVHKLPSAAESHHDHYEPEIVVSPPAES